MNGQPFGSEFIFRPNLTLNSHKKIGFSEVNRSITGKLWGMLSPLECRRLTALERKRKIIRNEDLDASVCVASEAGSEIVTYLLNSLVANVRHFHCVSRPHEGVH